MEFKVKFLEKINRTPSVASFRFRSGEVIRFVPGQFVGVRFDEKNRANRQLNKYLSFSSSPTEPYIEVTKRLSESEFSQRMLRLKPGDEVLFDGPLGKCVFNEADAKIGFLIGGIGITPVISIIQYITEKRLPTDAVLLYSNRIYEEIAFKAELDAWQKKARALRLIYTLTDYPDPDAVCRFGRIDKQLVGRQIADISERRFFIYGPPPMVEAMKALCRDAGCKEDMIMAENFVGY
ncbi:MAG: FAD-dependent oxidoreductase [Candidatus Omnitrophica bacterium]|nr:FAD-dependent oxidoreductase [Candidatus Omnitrophota bacterium]